MSKRFRFFLLLAVAGLCVVSLFPSFRWYFLTSEEQRARAASSRESIRDYAFKKARSNSDDIVALLLSDDAALTVSEIRSKDTYNTSGTNALLEEAKKQTKRRGKDISKDATVTEVLSVYDKKAEVYDFFVSFYREGIISLKEQKKRIINLGLDLSGGISAVLQVDRTDLAERLKKEPSVQDISEAIDRAMIVLNSRIDRFGVSEPRIRKQNADSILIEIPGDDDRERVNSFIKGKGSMAFHIVDEDATQKLIELRNTTPSWVYNPNDVPDFVPAGTTVMEYVVRDEFGIDKHRSWLAVYQDVDTYGVDGKMLQQAQVTSDPLTNRPLVNFRLDGEGAQKLAKLTGEHKGKSMAIVLGNTVRAYATITTVINDGQAVIHGFDRELAQDIAVILQTAVLPVKLNIVNQKVIGPTLGKEVIQAGINAIIVGFLLVIAFMVLYYKGAGVISIISLLCNLFLLSGILAAFHFTITLTGIAGIILTVGMAVDANVLIYERIKEELWAGKTRRTAIHNGFNKAFLTIIDANITTFIAAFFIAQIASGPIQGFAVTLSAGIVTTLFSSLFISRLLFDFFTDVFRLQGISISWRKKKA